MRRRSQTTITPITIGVVCAKLMPVFGKRGRGEARCYGDKKLVRGVNSRFALASPET